MWIQAVKMNSWAENSQVQVCHHTISPQNHMMKIDVKSCAYFKARADA